MSIDIFQHSLSNFTKPEWCDIHYILYHPTSDIKQSSILLKHSSEIINFYSYFGAGWDIGSFQYHCMLNKSYDYIIYIGSNTRLNFCQLPEHLERILLDKSHGLIGFSASLEAAPHIRTNVFMIQPSTFLSYPFPINSKDHCARFEHSVKSIYSFCNAADIPCAVAFKSGLYDLHSAVSVKGSFRSGEQANLLFHDRHTDIYLYADDKKRKQLELLKYGHPLKVIY